MLAMFLHRRCHPRTRLLAAVLSLLLALGGVARLAQAQAPHAFLYLVAGDTLGVERVMPGRGSWMGDLQMRGQPRIQWTATLPRAGHVSALALVVFQNAGPDAPVVQRATLTLAGDTVRAQIEAGGRTMSQALPSRREALLLLNASIGMTDFMLDRARAQGGAVDTLPLFGATGGQTVPGIVTIAGDSATMTIGPVTSVARLDAGGRVREVEIPSQRLRAVRVDGAALATLKVGAPDYSAPAGAPYTAEDVTIPATGGHTMAGTLTLPTARSGRVPVVVTISGSGPQDRDEYIPLVPNFRPFRQLADTLGRRGIAVLRFDDRGTGASGGDFGKATSADFADDVRSIVRWLRARPEIDPDKVMLAGHSEGGMIAPMVAATDPRLAGIVLLAGPGEKGETILRFQLRNLTMQDTSLTGTRRDSALAAIDGTIGLKRDNPWMRFFLEYDPIPTVKQVKVPVYIAQGATDQQVLAPQAQVLADVLRAAGNTAVTLKVFPNLNHFFLYDPDGSPLNYTKLPSGRIGGDVMGPIADWVVQQGARRAPGVVP